MKKYRRETYEYAAAHEWESQYENVDLDENLFVNAVYVETASDKGNPYIEALPKPMAHNNRYLESYQKSLLSYNVAKACELPPELRLMEITQVRTLRMPLPFQKNLESTFYNSLVASYRLRYRLEDEAVWSLDFTGEEANNGRLVGDINDAANSGFALLGYSGCGKSSSLQTMLSHYPQVIYHYFRGNRIPQVVYLVVSCLPNSNFSALYDEIGVALDRAMGLTGVYGKMIEKVKKLSRKAELVCDLVERFAIGAIIFDEIQLIDFSSTKENSFEALMVLTNRTKVAIGVVGTEDAYEKMFNKARTVRRVGVVINGNDYCHDRAYFKLLVYGLTKYQWFDERVTFSDDMIEVLYQNTHGVVAFLVELYIIIHQDYLQHKTHPVVDADYIERVAARSFKTIKGILPTLQDPLCQTTAEKFLHESGLRIQLAQDSAIQNHEKTEFKKVVSAQSLDESYVAMAIKAVTGDYNDDSIHAAFVKVLRRKNSASMNQEEITREVFKLLQNGKKDRQKKAPRMSHEEMKLSLLEDVQIIG